MNKPGDVINAEVYAKYLDTNQTNWSAAVTNLITSIANGTAAHGGAMGSTGGALDPFAGLLSKGSESGTAPKAYLNYLIFDRNYNVLDGGFVRVTEAAKESGTDVPHEKLSKQLTIKEAGYVYIYLSNDNVALGGSQVEVYFDDFKVEQIKSPVIQAEDYYPFGLVFNSYQRENSVDQKFKFQGQEHIDDLDLGWDSFKWRNHQPEIGRFFNVDPLAEKYPYYSPYAFSGNEVTSSIELEGLEPLKLFPSQRAAAEDFGKLSNDNSIRDNREYGTKIYSMTNSAGVTEYGYAIPVVGSPAGLSGADMSSLSIPAGGTVTAYGHTHAASTASSPTPYADNVFSGLPTSSAPGTGDVGFAVANGIDGYVATPNGSLQEYAVATGAVTTLSTAMPSDSGTGTGAPGAGVSAPSTSTYSIQSGDTLTSIAKRYMTTVSAIQTENGISDPNKIKAGTTLNITN